MIKKQDEKEKDCRSGVSVVKQRENNVKKIENKMKRR